MLLPDYLEEEQEECGGNCQGSQSNLSEMQNRLNTATLLAARTLKH